GLEEPVGEAAMDVAELEERRVDTEYVGGRGDDVLELLGGIVIVAETELAPTALEVGPDLVDLVVGLLTLKLDARADGETVVERGLALEVDFDILPEDDVARMLAGIAAAVILTKENTGRSAVVATYTQLNALCSHRRARHKPCCRGN